MVSLVSRIAPRSSSTISTQSTLFLFAVNIHGNLFFCLLVTNSFSAYVQLRSRNYSPAACSLTSLSVCYLTTQDLLIAYWRSSSASNVSTVYLAVSSSINCLLLQLFIKLTLTKTQVSKTNLTHHSESYRCHLCLPYFWDWFSKSIPSLLNYLHTVRLIVDSSFLIFLRRLPDMTFYLISAIVLLFNSWIQPTDSSLTCDLQLLCWVSRLYSFISSKSNSQSLCTEYLVQTHLHSKSKSMLWNSWSLS